MQQDTRKVTFNNMRVYLVLAWSCVTQLLCSFFHLQSTLYPVQGYGGLND